MPWQIKTRLNQALRSILGLIDYPKKMYVSPHLLSTINYQELMQEFPLDIRTSYDATTNLKIAAPKGYHIQIKYGRLKYTAAAAAANRIPICVIRDSGDTYSMAWWQTTNAITSGQTKWIMFTNTEYEGEGTNSVIDPIISQFHTPHWIVEKDFYKIYTANAQTGDTIDIHLRLLYKPVPKEWRQ